MKNPTLSELAQKLNITKPSASVMIDRLKDHGYLIKVKSDNDRRSAHVHLTDKGEKAAQVHTEVHEEIAKLLSKELTKSEKEILIVLLNKAIHSFTK
jgi:DNA-binding MarR family transcriptional regulator